MKTINAAVKTLAAAVVVGYVRVSTEDQNLGPDAQRAALEAWATAHGAELVAVFEDLGVSGATPAADRPGLLAALGAVADLEASVLLVAKRDRLARDVVEAAMTERLAARSGARVVSAAGEGTDGDVDDPSGLLLRRLVDAFAEYERAMIRSRTKAALAVKKSRGELVGSVPFGYRLAEDGKTLVEVPEELEAVRVARELRAAGLSYRATAEELEARGFVSRNGRRFAPTQISRFLAA